MVAYERATGEDPDTGAAVEMIVRTGVGEPRFVELEFVETLMELRANDIDAYEHVWSIAEAFLNRGAPMEALNG